MIALQARKGREPHRVFLLFFSIKQSAWQHKTQNLKPKTFESLFLHEGHVVAVFLVDKDERERHEGVGEWSARTDDLVSDGHLPVFALGDGCDAYVGFELLSQAMMMATTPE